MVALIVLAGALGLLPPLLYGIVSGWTDWTQRWLGVLPLLLAPLLLVLTCWASSDVSGLDTPAFIAGVTLSVVMGWWGYRLQRRRPRASPTETLLAMLAAPTPSARKLRPEDVLGAWQFYVDAATSMVTVELRADGHYSQVIVGSGGERNEGPGGTWSLEDARLELSAYRSVVRTVTERVRWLFGDWQHELVLVAQDDPRGSKRLLGQRRTAGVQRRR